MSSKVEISREQLERWLVELNSCTAYAAREELRTILAAPIVDRKPDAYLVTDIHGQKKALRSGAEGIERHRNAGSTLIPLYADSIDLDDNWYLDDCGNIRYKPEEE